MAKENLKQKEALQQEKINETVSKTEQFFNENKNLIYGLIIAVLVIGFGILAYLFPIIISQIRKPSLRNDQHLTQSHKANKR